MSHPAVSLKVLAEDKESPGVSKATTFRVDPSLVNFEEGFNLRADNDELRLHVDRLFEAMKAGAFIPPIDVTVSEGKIIVRDGHCRTEAALRMKQVVPEYTLECRQLRGNEADAVLHMLGTGSGSKPLTPLEQGIGYLRLIKMGLMPAAIAAKLGVSRVTIDNGLTLAESSPEIQQMISHGEVAATTARDAIKQGPEAVAALKEAVEEERKSPTQKKNGKKKKVTAKKLRGSAAEKKPRARKNASKSPELPLENSSTSNGSEPTAPQVTLAISRELATATAEYLRAFGFENPQMNEMAVALETALM